MASQATTTFTAPWFPAVTAPATQGLIGAEQNLPDLTQIYQGMPQLNVPGLDPTQLSLLGQLTSTGADNPDLAAARAQLAQLTGGPIGSSPATQAGMQAFEQQIAPIITQQSALRGTAGGGQAIEALGQGATAAALPLIQEEIKAREAAVGQYGQLGQEQVNQIAMALEASGLPREVALEQAQALFQRQQQQSKFATGIQTFPLQYLGQLGMGGRTSQPSTVGGDIIGAIGPILAALAAAA